MRPRTIDGSPVSLRGNFQITASVDCDDRYVSTIVLENLKDRATTIFAIYLEVDHGYYIEVEDFDEKPLVLRGFEAYQQWFGPIQLYGSNTSRIDVNGILADTKIRKRLVISTSDGKYVVPSPLKRWRPVSDFFANHMTEIIHPVRTSHKEQDIGSNIEYVVEFVSAADDEEIVLVRHDDFLRTRKFRTFALTKESLESKDALEVFLKEQMDKGALDLQEGHRS